MKTLFSFILITFSLSAFAAETACDALIEELGITPNTGAATMRKFHLQGKTKEDKACFIKFLPDFCTFELGAPLETPEMYYLKNTSYSSVKITFSNRNKFAFKAVTKESTDDWGVLTKTLRVDQADKGGYELKYDVKEGRFFKNDAKSFKCTVTVTGNS